MDEAVVRPHPEPWNKGKLVGQIHWMTTTFVAALRHDEITAPCVFDGPMNGMSFLAYVIRPRLQAGFLQNSRQQR